MRLLPACLLAAILSAATLAQATTVRYLDLPSLVQSADLVVLARPLTQVVAWEAGQLVTLSQLEVLEHWHADAATRAHAGRIELMTLGGALGDLGQTAGDPVVPLNRPLVLHLRRLRRDHLPRYGLWGGTQGIWYVDGDAVAQGQGNLRLGRPDSPPDGPRTLSQLRRAVLELSPHAN